MKKIFLAAFTVITCLLLISCNSDTPLDNQAFSKKTLSSGGNSVSHYKTEKMIAFEEAIRDMQHEMNQKDNDIARTASEFTLVLQNYLDEYNINYTGYEGNALFKLALDTHHEEIKKLNPQLLP